MTNGRRETSMRLPPIASRSSRPGPIMVTSVPSACTVAISRSARAVTLARHCRSILVVIWVGLSVSKETWGART